MIIVTRSVLTGINQSSTIAIFKFFLNKVHVYSKTHDYLSEYRVKFVIRGTGRE